MLNMLNILYLFKNKEKLTQQEINQAEEAKVREEEKRLYEEEHKALVEKYNEIYPTAIIIIKDFQIFDTRFSFVETVQEDDVYIYRNGTSQNVFISPNGVEYCNYNPYRNIEGKTNDLINEYLRGFKLIKNDFNEVGYKEFKRQNYKFQKSKTANSYYNITNGNLIYLNEQDWNVLIGKK